MRHKSRFRMELAPPEQAHLVDLFLVPEKLERVKVAVEFDEAAESSIREWRCCASRFRWRTLPSTAARWCT